MGVILFPTEFALLMLAQQTEIASVSSAGVLSNSTSYTSQLTADGSKVIFDSAAKNLVSGDTNLSRDVFLRDRTSGTTTRVSLKTGTVQLSFDCYVPDVSGDGALVTFESNGPFVTGDANGQADIFLRDVAAATTVRVSVDTNGGDPNDDSHDARISSDGMFVAFWSNASDLVGSDTNGRPDIFVRDLANGVTERVNLDSSGNPTTLGDSYNCAISGDGRFIAFASDDKLLVANDKNKTRDIFVRDRLLATTVRVSIDSSGGEADGYSDRPSISDDGRFVAFMSGATNLDLADTNGEFDIYVHDRTTGKTAWASNDSKGGGGNDESDFPELSADGRFVVFQSYSIDLVEGDLNNYLDIFVADVVTGATYRESVSSVWDESNGFSQRASLSADGRLVSFTSNGDNLAPSDTNRREDIFVRERAFASASWTNYGAGWPGTLGVPSLDVDFSPILNTTFTLAFGNSAGVITPGVLLVGQARASVQLKYGATLLVAPLLSIAVSVDAAGLDLPTFIDPDPSLAGIVLDLQGLLLDPGAVHGLAFTAGLELTLGF